MKGVKKIAVAIGLILGISGLFLALKSAGVLTETERNLSSHLYHSRETSEEIVIVAMDDRSFGEVSAGGLGAYSSWNRSYYGTVLEQIEEADAATVYFDIFFASPSDGLSTDDFYQIATEYPQAKDFTVQVVEYFQSAHPYDQAFADVLSENDNVFLMKRVLSKKGWDSEYNSLFEGSVEPIGLFAQYAKLGFPNASVSEGSSNASMIFSIPRYFKDVETETIEQGVDFQIAEAYLGRTGEDIPLEDGQMLINYAAAPYYWPTVSFSDVYNGRIASSVFKDKVVLIGGTSAILQDRHFTPIDAMTPMPGVEIHANAIQTILDGAYLQDQSVSDFLVQTVLSLAVLVSVSLFFAPWMGGVMLILMLLGFPFYAQWRFDRGVVLSLLLPVMSLILAYLAVLLYRNFTEFAEKRKLKEAFGRYVSPELVAQISEHPELLKLGGERRAITALFLDIENFTNLSESLEPQAVVSVINTYFDALSKVIMSKGGTVDKFEGDAIMALFGAPVPSEDHGLKACETALAIREKMAELNASTGYKLNIRIGLATGDAIVGNMGSENRFDYTAMGDTVNTASRLEGANKFYSTRILVTEGTYEAAKDQFFMRQVDLVCLKGKDKAIRIYEILGPLSGATEEGHKVVAEWDKALEAYRAGHFEEAEKGFRAVLATLPDDGPSKTLLGRIATLKLASLTEWDGVWKFESK